MCWCLSNCRKTCLTVRIWERRGCVTAVSIRTQPAAQAPVCEPAPTTFLCVIFLDRQHRNADKRSLLMESSAKGPLSPLGHIDILSTWTSGSQVNKPVLLTPSLTGDALRLKVSRSQQGWVLGVRKEILLQWENGFLQPPRDKPWALPHVPAWIETTDSSPFHLKCVNLLFWQC